MSLTKFVRGKTGSRALNSLCTALDTALALLAPLASPTFTGTVTAANITVTGKRKFAPSAPAVNITTAGAGTYAAADLDSGVITRDPNGADRTDTTDTAANLIATLLLTADFQERECLVVNTADAAEAITLAAGAGVTLQAAIAIPQGAAARLAITRTGAAAVSIRRI